MWSTLAVTVLLDPAELREQLALRGLLQKDLALLAGLSETSVSLAMRGRPVRAVTFARIARGLAAAPVVELAGADRLLARRALAGAANETAASDPTSAAAITMEAGEGGTITPTQLVHQV